MDFRIPLPFGFRRRSANRDRRRHSGRDQLLAQPDVSVYKSEQRRDPCAEIRWLGNRKTGRAELGVEGYFKDMNEQRQVHEVEANSTTEHQAVLVETEGFQCMAYQDCRGRWRTFYGLELLPGQVEVVISNYNGVSNPGEVRPVHDLELRMSPAPGKRMLPGSAGILLVLRSMMDRRGRP